MSYFCHNRVKWEEQESVPFFLKSTEENYQQSKKRFKFSFCKYFGFCDCLRGVLKLNQQQSVLLVFVEG
jgi:hypothetical protein